MSLVGGVIVVSASHYVICVQSDDKKINLIYVWPLRGYPSDWMLNYVEVQEGGYPSNFTQKFKRMSEFQHGKN